MTAGCGDATGSGDATSELTSLPSTTTEHNALWSYSPAWTQPSPDPVELRVDRMPVWASFDTAATRLSGVPGWDQVGVHRLTVSLVDRVSARAFDFAITVEKGEIRCDEGWPETVESAEYVLPYREGAEYHVSQSYCNPTNSHDLLHAYDIDTEVGDTLLASRAGVVLFVRDDFADHNATAGQENWVWIQHPDGSVMNYVHLTWKGALVAVGDTVAQGQPIALSGNSGLTHRPHVHTALYRDDSDFSRKASIPIAYRNAIGSLDGHGGLRVRHRYVAGPPGS